MIKPSSRIFLRSSRIRITLVSKQYHQQHVRVRFAPSPTGLVHLGGLRTAFFNYLFARKNNGKFILRIEDTDRERIVDGSMNAIIDVLRWSNLEPDEGPEYGGNYGPYIQSERSELYREMIEKLLETDSVYRCFCTTKRLELLRREALKNRETPRYDNRCRSLSNDEIRRNLAENKPYTVRLKLKPGPMEINDIVYGTVTYDLSRIEGDPILFKSDGLPTYHFANVVDDHHMAITHVLRGVEWLVSTPKHFMLYDAFGWPKPRFAHLPLLVNTDGSKLSKRHDHIHVNTYRNQGYYPEALINYLTQLGGGFGHQLSTSDCNKIYSINELVHAFDLGSVNQNNCKIDPEKLRLLNRLQIQNLIENNPVRLRKDLIEILAKNMDKFEQREFKSNENHDEYIDKCLRYCSTRISSIKDLISDDFRYLWSQPKQTWTLNDNTKENLIETLRNTICILQQMNDDEFNDRNIILNKLKEYNNDQQQQQQPSMKFNLYMKLLRLSLTNLTKGPPVAESIQLLGRNRTIQYLNNSIDYIESIKMK